MTGNSAVDRAALEALQLERLQKSVRWAKDKSAFYQDRLSAISPDDIGTLKDIENIPFTTMADIAETSPFDFLTMPMSGLLRITQYAHAESITGMYSAADVANHVETVLRSLKAAGVNRASVVGISGDMSDSILLDFQYASEMLGALTIPLGENLRNGIELIELAGADILIARQACITRLIAEAQTQGKEPSELTLRKVFCVNEAVHNPMKRDIADRLQVRVYDMFHSAALGTAGIVCPCEADTGAHVQEDMCIAEVVEFDGERAITEPGCMGELIVTSLVAEAMPILRYRTGQAVMRLMEECSCGSKMMRIASSHEIRKT
ncbi:hypothetical protein TAMA11512_09450 [Selenomonas sp. TAMA-11512]|uniref:phenylacetate--CoA ligase family protein n=1 Tax=Selenomonas sp. TAMA-11512 TaxID=3095337 RepID=UPI003088EB45|nr:hypothetical protein TAMA11512_09450 [Selenomonas sp. TAMA-11512]